MESLNSDFSSHSFYQSTLSCSVNNKNFVQIPKCIKFVAQGKMNNLINLYSNSNMCKCPRARGRFSVNVPSKLCVCAEETGQHLQLLVDASRFKENNIYFQEV